MIQTLQENAAIIVPITAIAKSERKQSNAKNIQLCPRGDRRKPRDWSAGE